MSKSLSTRRGYALMLVLLSLTLFLALLGVTYRRLGSAVRVVSAQTVQRQGDEGSLQALARGLALLETGPPPTTPYVCGLTINTSDGPRAYTVTFTSEGGTNWSVHAARTPASESPLPMPDTFASIP
jgi:hypothetical protein